MAQEPGNSLCLSPDEVKVLQFVFTQEFELSGAFPDLNQLLTENQVSIVRKTPLDELRALTSSDSEQQKAMRATIEQLQASEKDWKAKYSTLETAFKELRTELTATCEQKEQTVKDRQERDQLVDDKAQLQRFIRMLGERSGLALDASVEGDDDKIDMKSYQEQLLKHVDEKAKMVSDLMTQLEKLNAFTAVGIGTKRQRLDSLDSNFEGGRSPSSSQITSTSIQMSQPGTPIRSGRVPPSPAFPSPTNVTSGSSSRSDLPTPGIARTMSFFKLEDLSQSASQRSTPESPRSSVGRFKCKLCSKLYVKLATAENHIKAYHNVHRLTADHILDLHEVFTVPDLGGSGADDSGD